MSNHQDSVLPETPNATPSKVERILEQGLFSSRWLLAPMYVGLALAMVLPVWMFLTELIELLSHLPHLTSNQVILGVLELIDLTMAANLVLIVVFSGYENFVSKMDVSGQGDQPDWKSKVDFSTLKMKLIASMVAISGIQLLKIFMQVEQISTRDVIALISLHLVFVVSGVLLALMDYLSAKANTIKSH